MRAALNATPDQPMLVVRQIGTAAAASWIDGAVVTGRKIAEPLLSRAAVSDHFDGAMFFNPDGQRPRGFRRSPEMAVGRRARPLAARLAEPVPAGDARRNGRRTGRCGSTMVGHATLLIQMRRPQHPDRSGLVASASRRCPSSARSGSTRPASPSPTCRRSTSCWSATTTTTISISPRWRACKASA